MSKLLATLGFIALLLPVAAGAQESQPQPESYCPNITQDLKRGDCDEGIVSRSCQRHVPNQQVTELQTFLSSYYDDYPDDALTGKFFNTTKSFVKRFQREQNLPAFGYVGALTRAAIARVCGTATPPPADLSCIFNGWTVQHGQSVTAYLKQFVGDEEACKSETRICTNGVLSGTYQYASCSHRNPENASCTWNGQTIAHGSSVTAYQASTVPAGQQCQSQTRTCTNGTLSGTYQYATCTVQQANTPTITTVNTQDPHPGDTVTITGTGFTDKNDILFDGTAVQINVGSTEGGTKLALLIPANYPTGDHTYAVTVRNQNGTSNATNMRVRAPQQGTASCTLDGVTVAHAQSRAFYSSRTSANCASISQTRTCTNGTFDGSAMYQYASCSTQQAANPNAGACTYKGQMFKEGSTTIAANPYGYPSEFQVTCDNTVWTIPYPFAMRERYTTDVCENPHLVQPANSDLGCTYQYQHPGKPILGVISRHGRVASTTNVITNNCHGFDRFAYSISWGDGTPSQVYPAAQNACASDMDVTDQSSHTYATPGNYTISYTATTPARNGASNSTNIRVDGPIASTQKSSQLANAFSALEPILRAILRLFGQ